ncbi:MAG: hypothetical protein WBF73_06275 [Bradyrhizobium sp.]
MSSISRIGFGAIAVSLTLGALQFASGHDLTGGLGTGLGAGLAAGLGAGLGTDLAAASDTPQTGVNRAARSDRAGPAVAPSAPTRTISIRLDRLADTSVLIRIPVVGESSKIPPAPFLTRPGDRKLTVACEPVVSVLTEVAKLLRPGRCVT